MIVKKVLVIFLIIVSSVYAKDIHKVGERMMYAVKWNNIRVGVSTVELVGIEKIKTKSAYHFVSQTWTQGIVNIIFRVKDRVETFIDTKTHYPLLYKKDINEGKYHKKAVYEFNHDDGMVNTPSGPYAIPVGTQDPLSILAYFRSLDIKVNDVIDAKYFADTETRNLRVSVTKKEIVRTPLGEFRTNVVGFSVGREERTYLKTQVSLWLWFTDDDRKIPVFAKCNTQFGAVTGTLIDYVEGKE